MCVCAPPIVTHSGGLLALYPVSTAGDLGTAYWLMQAPVAISNSPPQLCLDKTGRVAVLDAAGVTVTLLYNGTGSAAANGIFRGYLQDNGDFGLFSPACDQLASTGAVGDGSTVTTPPCLGTTPKVTGD